jgi:hypothetical protein
MSFRSSKTTTKVFRWTLCDSCHTPRPKSQECKTCLALSAGALVPCDCGNSHFAGYRSKDISRFLCIKCIVSGHKEPRTETQIAAMDEYVLCPGICGLKHRNNNWLQCRFCFALADVEPELRRVLTAKKVDYQRQKNDAKYQRLWQASLSSKIATAIPVKEKSVVATDDSDDELKFLELLRTARRGVTVAPPKAKTETKEVTQVKKTPRAVVTLAPGKYPEVETSSLSEFPALK